MNYLKQLEKFLDTNFVKLPNLPKGGRDFIVSVAPWLALIFGILAIIAGFWAFGATSIMSPFAAAIGVGKYTFVTFIMTIILIIQGLIELIAFSPLKANKIKGWNLMFYSLILSFVSSIFSLQITGIISSLFWSLVGYYFLYQVKTYYK